MTNSLTEEEVQLLLETLLDFALSVTERERVSLNLVPWCGCGETQTSRFGLQTDAALVLHLHLALPPLQIVEYLNLLGGAEIMFPSLPDYRRFAEATIQRINKARKRKSSDRPGRMLFNVVLLACLWGVPLYGRWLSLSDKNITQDLPEAVLGRWLIGEKGDRGFLEFTPKKQVRLIRNWAIIESADYEIIGDSLWVSNFKNQPREHPLPVDQQRYQISVQDDRLIIKPASAGFTRVPDHANEEGPCSLRLVLPPWHGVVSQFHRVDNP